LRHGVFDEKTREVQLNRAKKFSVNQHLIYLYNWSTSTTSFSLHIAKNLLYCSG